MKTMTVEEFRAFCKSAQWVYESGAACGDREAYDGHDDDGNEIIKPIGFAQCWKSGSFDGVEVVREWDAEWNGTDTKRFSDDFETSTTSGDYEWHVEGVTLIDDEGEPIGRREEEVVLRDIANDGFLGEVCDINTEELIPEVATDEIDMGGDMEEFELDNDNAPNVAFRGEEIASQSSRDAYRNDTRWTVYKIFRTAGGKLIGQTVGCSQWQGEDTRYKAKVCESEADLIKFLGYSDAAKEAYEEAGIDATVKVE